jgi:hypothetical protein
MPDTLAISLAEIAQTLWQRQMKAAGWHHGPYDPAARTHDALVPFEALERHDRRRLVTAVASLELESQLLAVVDHQRGPEREFTLEEMRVGLPVTWAEGTEFEGPDRTGERGRIESWAVCSNNPEELDVIRVRWADGSLLEHFACEQALRRVEP